MSLNDILQIERERINRERVVITTIYDRMKNRVNNSVKVKAKECVYTIPEFIPGYPLVDVHKTMTYLLNKLVKEGFIAVQLTPLDIYITWDPEKIKKLNKHVKIENTKMEYGINSNTGKNSVTERRLAEKEFERANENFITTLINAKKSRGM